MDERGGPRSMSLDGWKHKWLESCVCVKVVNLSFLSVCRVGRRGGRRRRMWPAWLVGLTPAWAAAVWGCPVRSHSPAAAAASEASATDLRRWSAVWWPTRALTASTAMPSTSSTSSRPCSNAKCRKRISASWSISHLDSISTSGSPLTVRKKKTTTPFLVRNVILLLVFLGHRNYPSKRHLFILFYFYFFSSFVVKSNLIVGKETKWRRANRSGEKIVNCDVVIAPLRVTGLFKSC